MKNSKLVEELNLLLTRNYDAEKGYKNAASDVNDEELKMFFSNQEKNRYNFGHRLKDKIKAIGGSPNKGSSAAAGVHRVWMDLKALIGANDEAAVISEAIRGEEKALKDYTEILTDPAVRNEAELKEIIQRQRISIESAVAQLREFKNKYEYA